MLCQPGEIIFGDGCSKLCQCAGNYTFECVDNSCDPTEECRDVNGVLGCYPKGKTIFTIVNTICVSPFSTDFQNLFILVDTSTCIASGDPHYKTFDGRTYDFMGNCSYLMSAPCNKTFVPYFEVHADNENRFNQFRVTYLKAVHVYVHNIKISILKGGTAQVTATVLTSCIFDF